MDSMQAMFKGMAAMQAGAKQKIFDWDKAAQLIKERGAREASAGLSGDWDYTGGPIFSDGEPVSGEDTYVYLSSNWATPQLDIDGDVVDCFINEDDNPNGWNQHTYWPESALAILRGA